MSDKRKSAFKQGLKGGETRDRLRKNAEELRKDKRSLVSKRLRESGDVEKQAAGSFSEVALADCFRKIKVSSNG